MSHYAQKLYCMKKLLSPVSEGPLSLVCVVQHCCVLVVFQCRVLLEITYLWYLQPSAAWLLSQWGTIFSLNKAHHTKTLSQYLSSSALDFVVPNWYWVITCFKKNYPYTHTHTHTSQHAAFYFWANVQGSKDDTHFWPSNLACKLRCLKQKAPYFLPVHV